METSASSGNARRPETSDVNRVFHNLIEYEPVACLKKKDGGETEPRVRRGYV
jgi:hypothetical protein